MKSAEYATDTSIRLPNRRLLSSELHVVTAAGRRPKKAAQCVLVLAISFSILLLTPLPAGAWKPNQHIHTGNEAIEEILNGQDQVTINGNAYDVDSEVAEAIRKYPEYYRAGCVGPDGFPDIAFGQMIIHPDWKQDGGTYTHEWLEHVYKSGWAYYNFWGFSDVAEQALAFTYGFLTHAAGDLWGHTLINDFAGGGWPEDLVADLDIAIRHVIVESYIAEHTPSTDLSVDWPSHFIYETFIGDSTATDLASKHSISDYFGIPFFVELREDLVEAKNDINLCEWWEWLIPGYDLICPIRELQKAYLNAWIADIDAGLEAWPDRMGEISIALFVNNDFDTGKDLLEQFAYDHLLSMYGAPDFVGGGLDVWDTVTNWVEDLLDIPIPGIDDLIWYLIERQYGISFDKLKEYFKNPANYINAPPLFAANTSDEIDALMAVSNGEFHPGAFAANNNTIILAKMILLSPQTLNKLLSDYGVGPLYGGANSRVPSAMWDDVMLGFIRTLDGNHQWRKFSISPFDDPSIQHSEGMPLWDDCQARENVFRVLFTDWENDNFPDFGESCICMVPSIVVRSNTPASYELRKLPDGQPIEGTAEPTGDPKVFEKCYMTMEAGEWEITWLSHEGAWPRDPVAESKTVTECGTIFFTNNYIMKMPSELYQLIVELDYATGLFNAQVRIKNTTGAGNPPARTFTSPIWLVVKDIIFTTAGPDSQGQLWNADGVTSAQYPDAPGYYYKDVSDWAPLEAGEISPAATLQFYIKDRNPNFQPVIEVWADDPVAVSGAGPRVQSVLCDSPGSILLRWKAAAGSVAVVEAADSPAGPWTEVSSEIPCNGALAEWRAATPEGVRQHFYRVRIDSQ